MGYSIEYLELTQSEEISTKYYTPNYDQELNNYKIADINGERIIDIKCLFDGPKNGKHLFLEISNLLDDEESSFKIYITPKKRSDPCSYDILRMCYGKSPKEILDMDLEIYNEYFEIYYYVSVEYKHPFIDETLLNRMTESGQNTCSYISEILYIDELCGTPAPLPDRRCLYELIDDLHCLLLHIYGRYIGNFKFSRSAILGDYDFSHSICSKIFGDYHHYAFQNYNFIICKYLTDIVIYKKSDKVFYRPIDEIVDLCERLYVNSENIECDDRLKNMVTNKPFNELIKVSSYLMIKRSESL